ncbi:MAG: RNA polymerase factor sigma-54 [Limnobacter sp.]|nr:RNA polymerase factor sigma-54 [Limnobacter sp.]
MQGAGLRLQAGQAAVLSAQVQHGLKMLQMSALELEQEVAKLLETNPLLERPEDAAPAASAEVGADGQAPSTDAGLDYALEAPSGDSFDTGSSLSEAADATPAQAEIVEAPAADTPSDFGDAWPTGGGRGEDSIDPVLLTPARVSLREHLLQQVNVSALEPADAAVARLIVEALDADGYLRDDWRDVLASVAPSLAGSSLQQAEEDEDDENSALVEQFRQSFAVALRFVQSLDPAGVGARSVEECLRLQIERRPEDQPGRNLALRLVVECMDLLSAHDVGALTRKLKCTEAELGEAHQLIRSLAPRPAQDFAVQDNRYVIPEVIVREVGGKWVVHVNPDASPQVRINRAYASVVRSSRGWSNTPMGTQLSEARWLLRNLRQRADTIVRVAEAIVAAQQRFFEHGDIAIRPLFLRDIAAQTGLHESTISRVTAGKYMATPRGLIEFKHFFGSRLEAADGFRVSSRSIQVLIRDILATEDPAMPLSDIRLTKALAERGVKVARRTVTKYRDAIGIPPVDARRLNAMANASVMQSAAR